MVPVRLSIVTYNIWLTERWPERAPALERFLTLRGQRRDLMFGNELSKLAAPTLFAWGDRDAFGPPSIGQDASTTMKDARVEVVEGAAHLVHLDQPQRVASLVGDFLGASR